MQNLIQKIKQTRLNFTYPAVLLIVGLLGWYKIFNFWFFKAYEAFWLRGAAPYTFLSLMHTHAFIYYMDWKIFGWQPWGWYLTGLVLHLVATLLFYKFLYLVTKQRLFAFIAALLFVANACYSDVITWGSFNSYYALLLSCMFLTLIFFYYYRKTQKILFFFLTAVFFWISLLIRETGLTLAPLLIVFDFLFSQQRNTKKFWVQFILRQLPFYVLIAVFFKFRTLYGGVAGDGQDENVMMQAHMMAEHLYVEYARAIFLTMGKLIPPQFIPYPYLNDLRVYAKTLVPLASPQQKDIDTYFFPILGWILLVLISIFTLICQKSKQFGKVALLFWIWLGIFSFFVAAAVPSTPLVLSLDYTSITMRYRYFAFIGTCVLMAAAIVMTYRHIPKKVPSMLRKGALVYFLLTILVINLSVLWQVETQVYTTDYQPEKVFFTQFRHDFPTLPDTVVFYFYPLTVNLNNLLFEWSFIRDSWYPNLAKQPYRSESQMELILLWLKEKKIQISDVHFLDYNVKDGLIDLTDQAKNLIANQHDYPAKMTASAATTSANIAHYESDWIDGPVVELPYNAEIKLTTRPSGFHPTKDANSSLFRALAGYTAERQEYLDTVKIETCATILEGADPVLHLVAHNLIDGNTGGRSSWIADAIPGWVIADLGKQQEVDGVAWGESLAARVPSTYSLLTSSDKINWKEEKVISKSTKKNAVIAFDHPVMARYVKMIVQTTDTGNALSLDEFEVIGEKGKKVLSLYTDRDQLLQDSRDVFRFAASADDLSYAAAVGLHTSSAKLQWATSVDGIGGGSYSEAEKTYFPYDLNQSTQTITVPIPDAEIFAAVGQMFKKHINRISVDFGFSPSTISVQSVTLVPRQKL